MISKRKQGLKKQFLKNPEMVAMLTFGRQQRFAAVIVQKSCLLLVNYKTGNPEDFNP